MLPCFSFELFYIIGKSDKVCSAYIDFMIGDVKQTQSALAPMMVKAYQSKEYHDNIMVWHRDVDLMKASETFAIRFRILDDSYQETETE